MIVDVDHCPKCSWDEQFQSTDASSAQVVAAFISAVEENPGESIHVLETQVVDGKRFDVIYLHKKHRDTKLGWHGTTDYVPQSFVREVIDADRFGSNLFWFLLEPPDAELARITPDADGIFWRGLTERVQRLDSAAVIALGGWDARYVAVLAIAEYGDIAAALVDTNGDGADIDLDEYQRDNTGHWQEIGSGSAGDEGVSWSPTITAAWGRAAPNTPVEVRFRGARHQSLAGDTGWWLFIAPATDDSDEVPVRV